MNSSLNLVCVSPASWTAQSSKASAFFRVWSLGGSLLWPKFSITCWMKMNVFFIHFGYSKWRAYVKPNKTHIARGRLARLSTTWLPSRMIPALEGFSDGLWASLSWKQRMPTGILKVSACRSYRDKREKENRDIYVISLSHALELDHLTVLQLCSATSHRLYSECVYWLGALRMYFY